MWSAFSNRKGDLVEELQTQCDLRSPPKSIEDNFKMEKTVLVFKKGGKGGRKRGRLLSLSLPFTALTRARLESDFDGKSFRLSAPFYVSLDLHPHP